MASKLNFSYGQNEVLRDVNLTIRNNQIVAIVGKSGEGKSTFLNLIVGALTSSFKGNISILGFSRALSKEDIGYVPQELAIIPDLSIRKNIEFFGAINGLTLNKALKAGKELMEILHLDVGLTRLPSELSGGQKVRLNILVSFLHDPSILVLDEPFVGLDYSNRKLLWHFLQHQKNRHKTIIMTTHALAEAEHHADMIVILHKRKIYAKGKVEEIKEKLKIRYVAEFKFHNLGKSKLEELKKYCTEHDITILDSFDNYLMFALTGEGQKNYLTKNFEKLKLEYEEIGFREPNLDELSLKVIQE